MTLKETIRKMEQGVQVRNITQEMILPVIVEIKP